MAAPVNAQINVLINTGQATAQLRSLQASINNINQTLAATNSKATAQQLALNKALANTAKSSGMWEAKVVPMTTAMNQFSDSLDRGKMSLGEYTRYATSAMPGMSKIFRREFDMMTRVAEDRVKRMQAQYVNLGNSANGAGQALALTPVALDKYASSAAVATQRQVMMNRMIDLGSTKLLNWGKNTQWAGRQLMVGFSIPLTMMGAAAAKAFKEIDQSSIAFRRVYGDLQTTTAEMEKNLQAVKTLGLEYTKYGQSLASTIDLAAKVAATGAENQTLMAATEQTIRLATLGMMEYGEAMDATIALQTAFGVANEDLASTIDFLNVVENQTILSMQDMAAAIPRVAPVVRGLGGDVKDLAVFMTAMREGGISAEQGANALKSGLGRLINPTKAAREMLAGFNINIDAILQRNKGDLMGMVKEFGDALATLGEFEQQQVLQKVFGTYQYARLGALFKNISNDAGQAQRTMELTAMSVEDLAQISERELGRIEEATSVKFAASLERLKVAIAPIGELFMKAIMPIIDRVTDIANAFNNLPDGVKKAIGIVTIAIAGIAPVLIMVTGLFGNAIANTIKFAQFLRKLFARLKGNTSAFDHYTTQEIEARAAADALSGATDTLNGKFLGQQRALERLIQLLAEYRTGLASIQSSALGFGAPVVAPTSRVSGPMTTAKVSGPGTIKMAKGGIVPGIGNKDSIAAMLTPGESVVTKQATKKYPGIVSAMNAGTLKMLATAGENLGNAIPSPTSGIVYSGGESAARSHIIGLTPETLAKTLSAGLNNPRVTEEVSNALKNAIIRGVRIANNSIDVGFTEKNISARTSESLESIKSMATKGFAGTSLVSPSLRNSVFLESALMPENLRGEALLQEDYLRQLTVAQSDEIKQLEESSTLRKGANDFIVESQALERAGLLDKKNEVEFLKNRLTLMARQEQIDKGIITTKSSQEQLAKANLEAEQKASAQINEMTRLGVIRRRRIVDPQGVTQFMAAQAMSNPAVATKSPNIISRIVKRMALGKTEVGGKLRFRDKREFTPVSDELTRRDALARGEISQEAYEEGKRRAANPRQSDSANLSQDNAARNSPHPRMPRDGRDDQKAYDAAREAQAIKDKIRGQSAGGGVRGTGPSLGPIAIGPPLAIESREAVIARRVSEPYRQAAAAALAAARADEEKIKSARRVALEDDKLAQSLKQTATSTTQSAQQIKEQILNLGRIPAGRGRAQTGAAAESGIFATMSQAAKTHASKIKGAASAASMGLFGLSMAASFAGGSIGDMAMKIMPIAGLLSMLPMLMNPVGLVLAAMGGLAAGFIYLRKQLDDTAVEAARMGANIGGVANGMKIIEEATGFIAPNPEDRLFRFSEKDREAMTEFGAYFESEAGSKFIQDLKDATSEERYQKVSRLLAQGIASGLDEEKAKAFGFAIAAATGDALLKSSIARDFANQIFGKGSQVLLDLEKERMGQTPAVGAPPDYTKALSLGIIPGIGAGVESPMDAAVREATTTGAVVGLGAAALTAAAFGAATAPTGVGAVAGGVSALTLASIAALTALGYGIKGYIQAVNEQQKATEQAAKGLGFSLETIQNLANAEAVLEEERRNNVISFAEYEKRQAQLTELQQKNTENIGKILSIGADSGAMQQALADQLSFKKFTPDQIRRITENFSPDALAQQFFEQDYGNLGEDQKKYVQTVFENVMSGLTPENAEQRLLDVQGTYTSMAEKAVQAMIDGTMDGLGGFDNFFNKENIASFIQERMGGGITYGKFGGVSTDTLASNLVESDQELKKIGTDSIEVFTRLTEFINQDFAKGIMGSKDEIVKFGEIVAKLSEYQDIKLEVVMQKGIDPDEILYAIEQIKSIKFDTKIFGNAALDADKLVQSMIDLGYEAMQIPGLVRDGIYEATNEIKGLEKSGIKAFNKLGNIKITPQIVAEILDLGEADNANGIAAKLSEAFPDQLPTSVLPILIQLMGAEQLAALTSMPKGMMDFINKNPNATTYTYGAGPYGGVTYQIGDKEKQVAGIIQLIQGLGNATKQVQEKKKGGAGGGPMANFFSDQLADIEANAKLFGIGTESVIKKLRGLNVPEQLIEAMGTGKEGLANARKILAAANKMGTEKFAKKMEQVQKRMDKSSVRQTLSGFVGQVTGAEKDKARTNLQDKMVDGRKVEKSIIDEIVNNEEYLQVMKTGTSKQQDRLVRRLREQMTTEEIINEKVRQIREEHQKTEQVLDEQISKQEEIVQQIQDQIDELEKQNEEDQWAIRNKEREKELIDRQIEAIELLNEKDQQRIETLQRQDELRNREADALNHELEQLSLAEDQIRKTYQERLDALDKVAGINEYITQQQRQQLGLSQAISEGDIYAATAAAQEMRATSAQFSVDQLRSGLEQGMENAIGNLRTASGLTREQAEQRIKDIKEQSYQTSLLIRDIEDDIYTRNQSIIPLKELQRKIDNDIRDIADRIFNRETTIHDIREKQLGPQEKILANLNKEKIDMQKITDEAINQIEALADQELGTNELTKRVDELAAAWTTVNNEIAKANKTAREKTETLGTFPTRMAGETSKAYAARVKAWQDRRGQIEKERSAATSAAFAQGTAAMEENASAKLFAGGKVKKYAGGKKVRGGVLGTGSRDSVKAMLTPGEFVVRKTMVNKYGTPMLDAINQGSFKMPKFAEKTFPMPQYSMPTDQSTNIPIQNNTNAVSTVNAPVYNTYDVKFNISGSNASPDEIANKVMFKIKQVQSQAIRGNRG